jgi:hypothetical protein
MSRKAETEQDETKEPKEFDELQAMRRMDTLLRMAPDDQTRRRITRWLFAKWGEPDEQGKSV